MFSCSADPNLVEFRVLIAADSLVCFWSAVLASRAACSSDFVLPLPSCNCNSNSFTSAKVAPLDLPSHSSATRKAGRQVHQSSEPSSTQGKTGKDRPTYCKDLCMLKSQWSRFLTTYYCIWHLTDQVVMSQNHANIFLSYFLFSFMSLSQGVMHNDPKKLIMNWLIVQTSIYSKLNLEKIYFASENGPEHEQLKNERKISIGRYR